MKTLLLDTSEWDLVLDINGNIAVADAPYSVAQDVASAVLTRAGELWYDTRQGVDYGKILGGKPNMQYIKSQMEAAALTVPTVAKAQCLFASYGDRKLTGQIQVIDDNGVATNVSF